MANDEFQERFTKEEKIKSTLARRAARQKLVQRIVQTLGFSSSGFWIMAMIHYVRLGELRTALIISVITFFVVIVTIAAKFISELFDSVLEKIEERLEDKTEPLATWIVDILENLVLKIWWALTLDFKNKYYQQLEYTCRDYLTQGLDKEKILKLEKIFIPLRITTQDINLAASSMIQQINNQQKNLKERQIWDFLVAMRNESIFKHMVILGTPGSGKTTLLRYITLTYVTNTQRKVHRRAPKLIPVLLNLRDICHEITNNNPPLADLITRQINKQRRIEPLNPPPNWFQEHLRNNKCLIMLDGLDEVSDKQKRQQVRDWIDEQIQNYPNNCFILASRPHGYKNAPLRQSVTTLEIRPFNLEQIRQFLSNWYLQTEIMSRAGENDFGVQTEAQKQADDLIKRIDNSESLADMAVNPLLLTMIATVHRRGNVLPGKRVELYREICQVLLEKRQIAKNISDSLTASQKQYVLQALALALMQNQTREFTLLKVQKIIKNRLEKIEGSYSISAIEFLGIIRDSSGLLVEIDLGIYQFIHSIFQDYLAAVEIKELKQENILIENLCDTWWKETIVFFASQSNSTNLIIAALKYQNKTSLQLALEIIDESLAYEPNLIREYIQKISIDDYPSELVDFLQELGAKVETLVISTADQAFLFKKILEDLRKTSSTSLSVVSDLLNTEKERQLIFNQFLQEYNYLNLIFSPYEGKIEVSEKQRINDFRGIYDNKKNSLNRNEIEVFRKNADDLTRLFCKSLGFKMLEDSGTIGQLYGHMIDVSNPAFQLNIRPQFPLIYACKTTFKEEDACKISGLLNKFGIYGDFFALLFVFDNYPEIRQQVRESPFKNDFIVLNHDQIWDILAAKSPIQQLTNCILEQIDLIAVSPYTVGGPVPEKMFFGRAEEEKTLLQNVMRNDYALLANRKTGKTSLLNRIFSSLKAIPNVQVFSCDLQAVYDYESFFGELAISYSEFEEEIDRLSELSPLAFRKVMSNIKQRNSNLQIIFIFDEVDELLAYDIQEKEKLFKTFRTLSQREHIRFIFSGTTTLVRRVRDPDSPFFNFCDLIKLELLEEKAARELITVPMRTLGVKFDNETVTVQRILDITARHPNIIQYICDSLIKIINEKQERQITKQDLENVVNSQDFYQYFESLIWGQSTVLEKLIVYAMWPYPEFTESEIIKEFKCRGIAIEGVKASLEILLTYSTLSKKENKYFFTFQNTKENKYFFTFREFAKLMEKRSDIKTLTEQYQQEVVGS